MRHFKIEEFKCRCCGEAKMDETFLRRLDDFRHAMNFPFIVTSGYRCPKYNSLISSTGLDGPHTLGRAVDINVTHERALRVIRSSGQFGFTGVGVMQKGPAKSRFIHLDDLEGTPEGPRPNIWTY